VQGNSSLSLNPLPTLWLAHGEHCKPFPALAG